MSPQQTQTGGVEYESVEELQQAWQDEFVRLMGDEWPDDEVDIEWDTTDDEAVLRLEEPADDVVHVERTDAVSRSIWEYFDSAINAAHGIHRLISTQENPMGKGDRKHSAMLAVPLRDNFNER